MSEIINLNQQEKTDIYLLSNFLNRYKYISFDKGEVYFYSLFFNIIWLYNLTYLLYYSITVSVTDYTKYDKEVVNTYKTYNLWFFPLYVSGISSIDSIENAEEVIFPDIAEINRIYKKEEEIKLLESVPLFKDATVTIKESMINLENKWLYNLLLENDL